MLCVKYAMAYLMGATASSPPRFQEFLNYYFFLFCLLGVLIVCFKFM